MCGNGSERTQHPVEFFGPDWHEWSPPTERGAHDGVADEVVVDTVAAVK